MPRSILFFLLSVTVYSHVYILGVSSESVYVIGRVNIIFLKGNIVSRNQPPVDQSVLNANTL